MEIWFHLANVLYVVSYLVADILWLRALAVLGGLSSLTWTLTTPTPSLAFIGWTLVYNTINMVQIGRLWQERRQVRSGGADAVCGGVPHAHPARVPAAPGGGPVAGSAGEGGVDRPGREPRAHARARVGTDGRESGRTRSGDAATRPVRRGDELPDRRAHHRRRQGRRAGPLRVVGDR